MASMFRILAFTFLVLLFWSAMLRIYVGGDSVMAYALIAFSLPVIVLIVILFAVRPSQQAANRARVSAGSDGRLATREMFDPPDAVDPEHIGQYDGAAASAGLVWDDVLEYRVWCRPSKGAIDVEAGTDYYCAFASFAEAREFALSNTGSDEPVVLVRQQEYIDEPEPGLFIHKRDERIAEWPLTFLKRPKRTINTIPRFFAADASANRLDSLLDMETISDSKILP